MAKEIPDGIQTIEYPKAEKGFGQYSTDDDESNAMLKAHAYLANQDGFVTGRTTADASGVKYLRLYIGSTSDPAGAGDLITHVELGANYDGWVGCQVASGKYFEITTNSSNAVTIYWHPIGTLIKPTDQD